MLRVALKGLMARKFRLVTTAIAVVLGVAFMSGTQVLTSTLTATFNDLISQVNEGIAVSVRSTTTVDSQFGDQRGLVDESLLAVVQGVDGVAAADGDVQGYAQFVDREGKAMGNPSQGAPTLGFAWSTDDKLNPLDLVEGTAPTGDSVVIDRKTAKDGDFAVGDQVTVLTQKGPATHTVAGIVKYGDADSPLGASIAAFELSTAQELFGVPGKLSSISVASDGSVSDDELAQRVQAVLPEGVEAISGTALIQEQQDDIGAQLGPLTVFMNVFVGVALVVGAFVIYNTFSIVVAQRTKEMALLRAVGASRRQVMGSVLVEALATGVVASVIGVVVGLGLALGLRALSSAAGTGIPMDELSISPSIVVSSILIGTVVTGLSALVPALRASRIAPVAAMREQSIESTAIGKLRIVAGLVMLVLGVGALLGGVSAGEDGIALVGLGALLTFFAVVVLGPVIVGPLGGVLGIPIAKLRGAPGNLARENVARNPRRTATTAVALILGVMLVGTIAILTESIKASIDHVVSRNFAGEFVLQSNAGFSGGLSPTLAQQVSEVPEVEHVAEIRLAAVEVEGSGQFLPAVDPSAFAEMVDVGYVEGDAAAVAQAGTIAVTEDKAEDEGWKVGDTVQVTFPNTGDQTLTIAAIYDESAMLEGFSGGSTFFVGLDTYDANVEPPYDAAVFIELADGVSLEQGRAAIDPVIASSPNAELLDKEEFVGEIAGQIDQITAIIYVLLMFAVFIALFGIANTIALSIFERTRELGLLRAVGMTRSQVRTTVRWEAVVISLLGTVIGLVLGMLFGWALFTALGSGEFNRLTFPVSTLVVVVFFAIVFGVVFAIRPARRASRLNILEAIATE